MNLLDQIYNKLSYRSRRKKHLLLFNKKLEKYKSMSENEFTMEYIETNAKYEHKKYMLTVVTITFLISSIMDAWKFFYDILCQLFIMDISETGLNAQWAEILVITIIILIFIIAFSILFYLTQNLNKLSKQRIFLEEVKAIKMEKKR